MADDSSIAMMQSVTGASSETCSQYLIATNGDIDAAVGLFFAAGDSSAPATEHPARRPSPRAPEDDIGFVTPQVASTLADGGAGGGGGGWEQWPGDGHGGMNYAYGGNHGGGQGVNAGGTFAPPPQRMSLEQQIAMATQSMSRLQQGGVQPASTWAGGPPSNRNQPPSNEVDAMFVAPPYSFVGTFKDALKRAAAEGQFLLVSLVDDSFASGCLNRDVFGNAVVTELLQCSYVLWQAKLTSTAGRAVADTYGVERRGLEVPTTLIVHPITRAELAVIKKQQLLTADPSEPLDATRMQDALLNFADSRPPPVVPTAIDPDSDVPSARSTPTPAYQNPPMAAGAPRVDPNEDPELAAALAMSEEAFRAETAARAGGSSAAAEEVVDVDGASDGAEAHEAAPAPVEVDLETHVVEASTEGALRLRVRLPSGAWNLALPGALPFGTLVEGVRSRLRRDGVDGTAGMSLLVGFPPKKVYQQGDDVDAAATLASLGTIRSGDVITPHV